MAASNYQRVSRKRVCRICGKSDWCSYTPDEKTSFCARVNQQADRVSRTGWGIFHHEKSLFPVNIFFCPHRSPPKKTELAPIEIRDFAYRKLLELAPATDLKEIIDGEKGLRARRIFDIKNSGALPQTKDERRELAREIRRSINRQFPNFVSGQKSGVSGLPGFWLDKNGRAQLWSEKDYSCPVMIIPYRDATGLVPACQLRLMGRNESSTGALRYVWLSTPDKNAGLSCGAPLHFAYRGAGSYDAPVLITEGALKAETVRVFTKKADVLANAGINSSHAEIAAAVFLRPVLLAFDADCRENPHAARALVQLLNAISGATGSNLQGKVKVLTWNPKFKGIDDALLRNASITAASPFEWYQSLGDKCRAEVIRIFPRLRG